ncbi:MAG: hypothetical protein D6743_15660 [Calditrichaeota bacterium]|nr:MAG: hypothetical protein D6743_15660 [Calditrichota bacterium]
MKFANESLVFTSVRGAVKRALTSQEVVPELTPRSTFAPPAHDLDSPEQPPKPFFFPSGGAGSAERDPSLFVPHHAFERGDVPEARQGQQPERPVFEPTNVWQVHNKYIISQIKNGLIVIDQHVAHERVLYEQAMRNFERRKPSSQQLLFPQVVELSAEDYNLLLEILPFLEQIGFVIKSFSKNTVVVEGVPSGIKISDDEKILLQILDEYKRGKRDSAEIRENVAKSYACHTAIRAGEPLTLEAMNALIDQLFSTNEPYFCPHGRPVLIHIPLDELDRRFRRH